MKQYFDIKINRMVYEIIAGEYVSTNKVDSVITTLLGSCVSVCLSDPINGVFGMNHFMLPGGMAHGQQGNPRYGICATDLLIQDMINKGAQRKYLCAKIFGAGKVMDSTVFNVARNNAEFIQKHLLDLKIPVTASDLGKNYGRKIIFYCGTGEVYVKKITDYSSSPEAVKRERQFFEWLRLNAGGVYH